MQEEQGKFPLKQYKSGFHIIVPLEALKNEQFEG